MIDHCANIKTGFLIQSVRRCAHDISNGLIHFTSAYLLEIIPHTLSHLLDDFRIIRIQHDRGLVTAFLLMPSFGIPKEPLLSIIRMKTRCANSCTTSRSTWYDLDPKGSSSFKSKSSRMLFRILPLAISDPLLYHTIMTDSLRVAISGAAGRMGIALIRALSAHQQLELTSVGIRAGSGQMARAHFEQAGVGFAGEMMVEQPAQLFVDADCVIDFTAPDVTVGLAGLAATHRKILVSGTTGLQSAQKEALIRASEQTRVVWAANMSVGVNLLMALVEQAAAKLGPDTDIEILEMHHRHKIDAPSGTALALGEAAARGRKVNLQDVWVKSRDGITGPRGPGHIGFATLRGGDVIGEHTVMFAGQGERLELSHQATSRDIFAKGALTAALWAANKPNGFYTMRDVVTL